MSKRLRGRFGYPSDDPFKVTFHPAEFADWLRLKKPSRIFLCSMGEIFDKDALPGWIIMILGMIEKLPQHTFIILTKQYKELPLHKYPKNVWLGVSVDTQNMVKGIDYLRKTDATVKFVSFEPLLEEVDVDLTGIDWAIIGSRTQPFRPPQYDWVLSLFTQAKAKNVKVFLKNNLIPVMGRDNLCQELPE